MPNQRSEGQRLINVPMHEDFIDEINSALRKAGFRDRSSFIRVAIQEKLLNLGIDVPASLVLAPSTVDKIPKPTAELSGDRHALEKERIEAQKKNRARLRLGMTTSEVRSIMGKPEKIWSRKGGIVVWVWPAIGGWLGPQVQFTNGLVTRLP